jgi:hypothetical protein
MFPGDTIVFQLRIQPASIGTLKQYAATVSSFSLGSRKADVSDLITRLSFAGGNTVGKLEFTAQGFIDEQLFEQIEVNAPFEVTSQVVGRNDKPRDAAAPIASPQSPLNLPKPAPLQVPFASTPTTQAVVGPMLNRAPFPGESAEQFAAENAPSMPPVAQQPVFNPAPQAQAQEAPAKRRRRWPWVVGGVGALLVIAILGVVGYGYWYVQDTVTAMTHSSNKQQQEAQNGLAIATTNEPITALIIGEDHRPGESGGRSDTMMMVRIDPRTKTISMLSFPRDLVVERLERVPPLRDDLPRPRSAFR